MSIKQSADLNKILYRAHYRGTKETSHIVTLFVKRYCGNFEENPGEWDINQWMEFVDTDDSLLFTVHCNQSASPLRQQFCKFLVDIQWFKDNLP